MRQAKSRLRTVRLVTALVLATTLVGTACTSTGGTAAAVATPTQPDSFLKSVESIAALGDSITQGVNACGRVDACPEASWSTGSDQRVDSVAQRIAQLTGTAPQVFNDSRSGARVSGLKDQVSSAIEQHPDLLTILIGANDICRSSLAAMTSVADFSAQIGATLNELSSGLPDAHIFVASVPDVAQLVAVAASVPAAAPIWAKNKVCGSAFVAGSDPADVAAALPAVSARIADYNAGLDQLCSAIKNCIYDGGGVTAQKVDAAFVSTVDYFHPSIDGQRVIAQTAWQAMDSYGARCSAQSAGQC